MDLAERLTAVHARIESAAARAGRDPRAVRLIAVTKTFPASHAASIHSLGIHDLGENRVQEAAAKAADLPPDVRWHLIGHLQTNKAPRAATLFHTVHSIDSERVAAALHDRRPDTMPPLDSFIEVELTGITAHTGVHPDGLEDLARAVLALPRLRLRGLMTMAPLVEDPELARPTFVRLRRLKEELEQRLGTELPDLSMGMSDDYEIAIAEGATMVRLGRALFGDRPPKPTTPGRPVHAAQRAPIGGRAAPRPEIEHRTPR